MDELTRKRLWCVGSMVLAFCVYAGLVVLMVRAGMAPGTAIATMIAVGSGSAYVSYRAWPRADAADADAGPGPGSEQA